MRFQPLRAWRIPAVALLALLLLALTTPVVEAAPTDASFGVFVRLGDASPGTFDQVSNGLRSAIEMSDWQLLAAYDAGTGEECSYRARVYVLHSPAYDEAVMAYGHLAAFALPVRVAVYEDEGGVHISAVNAPSLTRTIVSEESFGQSSAAVVDSIAQLVGGIDGVTASAVQYGQMRDAGLISKTMGIMAGGPFPSKVETIVVVDSNDVTAVADQIVAGFEELADDWKWKIRPVYKLDLSAHGVAVVGVTSDEVEARSFGIVGEGIESDRSGYACPGIAHSASYPVELVLVHDGDEVKVLIVDTMFRMKMYFEDAGKVAFAMNMRMPASIENEIRDKVEESVQ